MPLPPLPTQIADQINLSRQKTPDLKNPPKKMKKALAPSWAQEVEANVDIDDDLPVPAVSSMKESRLIN
ncbi:MAG: hypothetical protein EBY69_01455 [Burkholderiaceae bacterium]|nr:hypothetical protein [Burkholderiaceae bacterium]